MADSKRDLSVSDWSGCHYFEPQPSERLRRVTAIGLAKNGPNMFCRLLRQRFYEVGADNPKQIASAAKVF
jgi:hypothetical protein